MNSINYICKTLTIFLLITLFLLENGNCQQPVRMAFDLNAQDNLDFNGLSVRQINNMMKFYSSFFKPITSNEKMSGEITKK